MAPLPVDAETQAERPGYRTTNPTAPDTRNRPHPMPHTGKVERHTDVRSQNEMLALNAQLERQRSSRTLKLGLIGAAVVAVIGIGVLLIVFGGSGSGANDDATNTADATDTSNADAGDSDAAGDTGNDASSGPGDAGEGNGVEPEPRYDISDWRADVARLEAEAPMAIESDDPTRMHRALDRANQLDADMPTFSRGPGDEDRIPLLRVKICAALSRYYLDCVRDAIRTEVEDPYDFQAKIMLVENVFEGLRPDLIPTEVTDNEDGHFDILMQNLEILINELVEERKQYAELDAASRELYADWILIEPDYSFEQLRKLRGDFGMIKVKVNRLVALLDDHEYAQSWPRSYRAAWRQLADMAYLILDEQAKLLLGGQRRGVSKATWKQNAEWFLETYELSPVPMDEELDAIQDYLHRIE